MSDERSFAERLAHLIATVHPPDRKPYSYREIAHGVAEQTGVTMSATHVQQLAVGARKDPKRSHIQALAQFFGVPVTYFFDDEVAGRVDSQLALATALRDAGVRDAALRIMSLDGDSRRSVVRIIQEITQMHAASSTRDGEPSEPGPQE